MKKLKNTVLVIILLMALGIIPAFALTDLHQPVQNVVNTQTGQNVTNTVQTSQQNTVNSQMTQSESASQGVSAIDSATKIPMSKKELILKFMIAMLCVVASSVIIYVGLSLYNKFMYGTATRYKEDDYTEEDENYKTPANMKEALNIFLKKTK